MDVKTELVVKSNRLVEASYRLTLAEQRIILLAIVEARETGKGLGDTPLLEIRATDYARTFDIPNNQAYEQMKEASQTLFNRYVVFHDIHPRTGKERVVPFRWVSSAPYVDGAGIVQLRFTPDIVPFITRLEKEFTRYKLEKVANMSSPYAIRLYELLIQWGSVGEREVELAWLRKTLMLEKEYDRLGHFKERVINVALSQINQHSDLTASYTQRKLGRVVTHLIFKFQPKEAPKPEPAKGAKPKAKPSKADNALDESRARVKAQVVEFLTGNEEFKLLYPNTPLDLAWHVQGIRDQFMGAFDEWRQMRE